MSSPKEDDILSPFHLRIIVWSFPGRCYKGQKINLNKMAEYKVNKEKCVGCGVCVATCPGGIEIESDGKAKVIDSQKLEECGGESVCPSEAIEKEKE